MKIKIHFCKLLIGANYAQYFKNSIIPLAYAEDGYSQIEIANFLGLSKSAISMIIKSDKSGDWTVGVQGLSLGFIILTI